MTDIAKCIGAGCPMKENCYRYTAPANELWQSFFTGVPVIMIDTGKQTFTAECDHYWPLEE